MPRGGFLVLPQAVTRTNEPLDIFCGKGKKDKEENVA